MIVIDQMISYHTKFNTVHAHMSTLKGNLPAENASVQSVASGERRKKM